MQGNNKAYLSSCPPPYLSPFLRMSGIWIKSEKRKFWKKKKRNSLSMQLSQSEREDKKYYSKKFLKSNFVLFFFKLNMHQKVTKAIYISFYFRDI